MKISSRTTGLICGAIAAAAYGLNPLFAVPLYKFSLTPVMVLFYRFALAAVMLVPILLIKRIPLTIDRKEAWASCLGGALMVASSLCLYSSFNHMDVGLAMTILFVYPVIVAVIMSCFYGEKLSWSTIMSIVLALVGLVFITCIGKQAKAGSITLTGVLLALGSSLAYALYIVAVRKTAMHNMPCEKLTFYTVVFGTPMFFVLVKFGLALTLPTALTAWWYLLGVAFIPTIIALAFMAVSIEKVGATPTAILGVLEPVTGLLVGIVMYGEKLTVYSSIGIVLIFSAVMLVIVGDRKKLSTRQDSE